MKSWLTRAIFFPEIGRNTRRASLSTKTWGTASLDSSRFRRASLRASGMKRRIKNLSSYNRSIKTIGVSLPNTFKAKNQRSNWRVDSWRPCSVARAGQRLEFKIILAFKPKKEQKHSQTVMIRSFYPYIIPTVKSGLCTHTAFQVTLRLRSRPAVFTYSLAKSKFRKRPLADRWINPHQRRRAPCQIQAQVVNSILKKYQVLTFCWKTLIRRCPSQVLETGLIDLTAS